MAFNVGFRVRTNQDVQFSQDQSKIAVGHQVFGSVGARLAVWKNKLDIIADGFIAAGVPDQDVQDVPFEVLGGVRAYFPLGFIANVAAGGGVTRGIGAPQFRILWGVGWQFQKGKVPMRSAVNPDPDGDGILLGSDACPLVAEDKDNFEDSDGCPDPDNDKDGILDAADKCPNQPEDKDGFEDTDGCPDKDNDKDGIPDSEDKCPDEPEDKDGFQDADGCPDKDNDKDGIPDAVDKCPNQPEDKDGFQDKDGCPDPDNDKDGIPDVKDKCPNQPEDKDGWQDADGCPDPDNDGDGIPDAKDKCPNQPETKNGYKDDDGCPDQKGPVQIKRNKITAPPVYFATGKARILTKSYATLRLIAKTLLDNKWVKKVRIEGHTDSRGSASYNRRLSQKRVDSVMAFLIQSGVDPTRLEAKGYGEDRPIASNKTRAGRARNRRVEFTILDPAQSQNPSPPTNP
ncbi:MAG: OmpA family protein [Myxococcales bacterium]|nr:OmpA family protein [Myxococcales bacterium]